MQSDVCCLQMDGLGIKCSSNNEISTCDVKNFTAPFSSAFLVRVGGEERHDQLPHMGSPSRIWELHTLQLIDVLLARQDSIQVCAQAQLGGVSLRANQSVVEHHDLAFHKVLIYAFRILQVSVVPHCLRPLRPLF